MNPPCYTGRLHHVAVTTAHSDMLANAHESLELLRALVRNCLATKTHTQHDFGISDTALRTFLTGGIIQSDTSRKIGRAAAAPGEMVDAAAGAAALLHREAMRRGWQARRARPPVRRRRLPSSLMGRHYTDGGRWLRDELFDGWGSLNAFQRDTGIDVWSTLRRYFFSRTFHPQRAVLQRLADALNRRRAVIGDPTLNPEDLALRFGCGVTTEEWRRRQAAQRVHPSRMCPICGKPKPRGKATCSLSCRPLRMMFRNGLRTLGGKMLWALMAHAEGVPWGRIASCLGLELSTVEGWLNDTERRKTADRIRATIRTTPLLAATASVLGITRRVLDEYLHYRAHRRGKRGTVVPRWSKRQVLEQLAHALHVSPEEALILFGRVKIHENALAARIQSTQRRRWQVATGGRPRSICRLVRRIIRLRAKGCATAAIAARIADASDLPPSARGGNSPRALSNTDVRKLPIRHACTCRSCRALVARDLHSRGWSILAIARRLGRSVGTVHNDLSRGAEITPQFGYGLLTTHEAADRAKMSPDAIRWHADRGRILCQRTPNGWRQFKPKDIDAFLRSCTC
jgi:predicted nucleic acid-binding Zn ribbon protein